MFNSHFTLHLFDHPSFDLTANVNKTKGKVLIFLFQPTTTTTINDECGFKSIFLLLGIETLTTTSTIAGAKTIPARAEEEGGRGSNSIENSTNQRNGVLYKSEKTGLRFQMGLEQANYYFVVGSIKINGQVKRQMVKRV